MEADEFAHAIGPWTSADSPNLAAQLSVAVRHAIASGVLKPGQRLPAERSMAAALHVSRPTVSAVIDDLRQSGFVSSQQGSGSWIAKSLPKPPTPIPFNEHLSSHGLIDLAAAVAPDASLIPPFRIEAADVLAVDPANGLNPAGLFPLRSRIASRLQKWHSWVEPDGVMITSGAHQALALLIATLVPPGARVLVEDVTYGGLIDLIEANGGRPIPVPRDADGVCPDALAQLIALHSPALIVLVSSVHSPTGSISPDHRNVEIAHVLSATTGHVVIDETYADLEFSQSDRTLAGELGHRCILVGSLSKAAWLGLRTGWIATSPNLIHTITRERWSRFDLGESVPSQLVALQVLEGVDSTLDARRARLQSRADWLTGALDEKFPDWELTAVHGGLALWARLPGPDSTAFARQAADRGVAVLVGSACRADRGVDPHLRLCFDRPESVLEEAVDRL